MCSSTISYCFPNEFFFHPKKCRIAILESKVLVHTKLFVGGFNFFIVYTNLFAIQFKEREFILFSRKFYIFLRSIVSSSKWSELKYFLALCFRMQMKHYRAWVNTISIFGLVTANTQSIGSYYSYYVCSV